MPFENIWKQQLLSDSGPHWKLVDKWTSANRENKNIRDFK
jgi:hypothetical protein